MQIEIELKLLKESKTPKDEVVVRASEICEAMQIPQENQIVVEGLMLKHIAEDIDVEITKKLIGDQLLAKPLKVTTE